MNSIKSLSEEDFQSLVKIFKKYVNLYKILYFVDPAKSSEFLKRQEHFYNELQKNKKPKEKKHDHSHDHGHQGCSNKLENKFYIPKDSMNNLEKILDELSKSIFYKGNFEEILEFFSEKYEKVINSGKKDGLSLDEASEKELIHKFFLEGLNFFLVEKFKKKLKSYEESISEQPLLLAHPSSITNKDLINHVSPNIINSLQTKSFVKLDSIYKGNLNEYELFEEIRYLELEGNFDTQLSLKHLRTDLTLSMHFKFLEKSRHRNLNELMNLLYYLPFELNSKNFDLTLQTNEYIQISYFRKNDSYLSLLMDSSFEKDTGKKLTLILFIFPKELEIKNRLIKLKIQNQITKEEEIVEITESLSGIILSSRVIAYEIEKQNFNFSAIFYYIHGPADKSKRY